MNKKPKSADLSACGWGCRSEIIIESIVVKSRSSSNEVSSSSNYFYI